MDPAWICAWISQRSAKISTILTACRAPDVGCAAERRRGSSRRFADRAADAEGRTSPWFALYRDLTAVTLHDAVDDRETELRTSELGREERLEDPGLNLERDALTVVAHLEDELLVLLDGSNLDQTAFRIDCLGGVLDQVD